MYVHLAVLAETGLLVGISSIFMGKRYSYLFSIGALCAAGIAVIELYPPFQYLSPQGLGLLFGSMQYSVGVVETQPLTLPLAWDYFGLALLLTVGGFLVLGYSVLKKPKAEWIFLLIWSIVMLLLTVKFQRFDYYSTVNIVLLSAICITEPFRWQDAGVKAKISSLIVPDCPGSSSCFRSGRPSGKTVGCS